MVLPNSHSHGRFDIGDRNNNNNGHGSVVDSAVILPLISSPASGQSTTAEAMVIG